MIPSQSANSLVTIESKNKVYVAEEENLSQRYKDTVIGQYDAEIEQVNFGTPDVAANNINNWVNTVTKGLIPTLVTKGKLRNIQVYAIHELPIH